MEKISDRLWKKAGQKRIPLSGAFELLPVCNLQCKMCYVRKSMAEVNAAGGLLPAEFWLDIAKQAVDMGMLLPLITGGEPFLRKDIRQIIAGMVEMGTQVSINTNGTLIDEDTAAWLGKHRPRRINLTVYGASEETYQRLCGDGEAYAKMRRAVEWLKKYDIPLKFNASITPENVDDLENIIAFSKAMERPMLVTTYMFPPVRRDAQMVGSNDRLSPEQAGLAQVKAHWLYGDQKWFAAQAARYSQFVPVTEEMLNGLEPTPPQSMLCRAGRCTYWVDWKGNIGNCGMYLASTVSLRENDFPSAWEQIVRETDAIRYHAVCGSCPNNDLCHACIAMVYNECGSKDGRPEYICKMNEAAAKYYQEYAARLNQE